MCVPALGCRIALEFDEFDEFDKASRVCMLFRHQPRNTQMSNVWQTKTTMASTLDLLRSRLIHSYICRYICYVVCILFWASDSGWSSNYGSLYRRAALSSSYTLLMREDPSSPPVLHKSLLMKRRCVNVIAPLDLDDGSTMPSRPPLANNKNHRDMNKVCMESHGPRQFSHIGE